MWPKIGLFSALPFEKILLSVLYYLLMEFKYLQMVFYIQRVVYTDQAIIACSINKMGPEILYYSMPHLNMHYATCSSSTRVCLCATTQARQHMQQSSDSAFCVHRVCVLWNSSYASVCNTYIAQYCLKKNRLLYQHDWTTMTRWNLENKTVKFREQNCQSHTA